MHNMARRSKDKASVTLTIRMTREDRDLLDRLVAHRARELADEGLDVTATSVVRGLIRREARSHGLLPPLECLHGLGSPPPARVEEEESQQLSIPATRDKLERQPRGEPGEPGLGLATPIIPTGMTDATDLKPEPAASAASASADEPVAGLDLDDVRNRAIQAIRGRRFRQSDLVEHAKLPQGVVSRFLLGAETSHPRVAAIAEALDVLGA